MGENQQNLIKETSSLLLSYYIALWLQKSHPGLSD